MNKDEIMGLVLIGGFFTCIGSMVGGFVVHKIDKKYDSKGSEIWRSSTILFKELLIDSYAKNDELKKKIKSMEEA